MNVYLAMNFIKKKIDEKLKKKYKNTFKFPNNDVNKFILMLRKGVVLMNIWMIEKGLMKQNYLKKEEFYSNLNAENITEAYYMHVKRVCKGFEIKYLGEYHDLHLKSDVLLLADIIESFRKMCLKCYYLDSLKFISGSDIDING